jgi:nitroreductase
MELKNLINNWVHPIRFKSNIEVEKKTILKLVSAAHWAPSAENQQIWKFFVITNTKERDFIIKAIKQQDKRLQSTTPAEDNPKLNIKFRYSERNYNVTMDKYKDWISDSNNTDLECAKNSPVFILFMHSTKFLGEAYGQTDVGAAILNTLVGGTALGYDSRWIRNFDRNFIREKLEIPEDHILDGILAVGIAGNTDNIPEIEKKKPSDFFYMNRWGEKIDDLQQFKNQSEVKDYGVQAIDAILDRRSIRDFQEQPSIPQAIRYELVKAGMMPPLTTNNPYIKIIIVEDSELLQDIADHSKIVIKQKHVQQVPLCFVITYDCSNNSPAFYAEMDTGAIFQSILLRAHSLGIGSCWIGAFSRKVTKKILNIPDKWYIPSLAIFGYPNDYPPPTPRKDLGKICYIDKWGTNIQKRKRSLFPSANVFSILLRKLGRTRKKTILRERKVGMPINIPEFEKFI